jgi:hypothetical protein
MIEPLLRMQLEELVDSFRCFHTCKAFPNGGASEGEDMLPEVRHRDCLCIVDSLSIIHASGQVTLRGPRQGGYALWQVGSRGRDCIGRRRDCIGSAREAGHGRGASARRRA